jgi:hypothetical protein
MSDLKRDLLSLLAPIDGFTSQPSKVAGGTALFYKGREFAHFHHDNEIDLRLTRGVIKSLGLSHPERSTQHPTRSAGSQWIEVCFRDAEEVHRVAELVKLAIAQL